MSQDIYISVQPVTGEDIYVNVSPNLAGVLFVNGRDGIVVLNKSDVGLSNVENISITGVSGYLQYQIDQLDTGYASQTEINLLSGLLAQTGSYLYTTITNLSGDIVSNYATKIELNNTGTFLYNLVNALSGYGNGTFATITNLAATGSNLNNKINNLSGYSNNTFATIINLASTGQNLQNQINNLDINYASQNEFNSLSGNLISTGANLQSQINNLYGSGFITGIDLSSYATISNLQLTGQNLQNQINNLDNTYATDISLVQTGQFLNQKIDNFSGTYQNFINNLDTNYASQSEFDALSGNLNSTGQNLNGKINSLSGAAVLVYGDQYIDGQKIFRGEVRIKDLYVTGTQTIVNTTNTNVGSNYLLLNATGGAIDAGIFINTGNALTGINDTGAVIGYDVPANRWVFGNISRNSDLSQLEKIAGITDITNYSGFVNNNFYTSNNPSGFVTGSVIRPSETGIFYTRNNPSGFITTENVVYTTGDQIISGNKSFAASRYVFSGANVIFINNTGIVSGLWEFYNRPTVNGTGVLLSGEMAKLENVVFTTGNQTVSGLKDFNTRPTVNSVPVLLSGENPSGYITGVDLTSYATNIQINSLSGYINSTGSNIVFTTGNQQISGAKNFISRPTVNNIGVVISGDDQYYIINKNSRIVYGSAIYSMSFDGAGHIKTSYNSGDVNLNGRTWTMVEALIGTDTGAGEVITLPRSLRLRGYSTTRLLISGLDYGVSNFVFDYRAYPADSQLSWTVRYDINDNIWNTLGTFSGTSSIQKFTGIVNQDVPVRISIIPNGGNISTNRRVNLDNFIFYPGQEIIETPYPGSKFLADTSSGSFIFPLSGARTGDYFVFIDPYSTWSSNNLILTGVNGMIENDGFLFTGDVNGAEMRAIFVGKNIGWRIA